MKRGLAAALALLLASSFPHSAAAAPSVGIGDAQRTANTKPEQLQGVDVVQKLGEQIPLDLPFRDETGSEVKLGDYFGKRPVILALVYYECPMLCTLVLNGLVKALRPLSFEPGEEFDVVAVSFNPKEGPELAAKKKANYLENYERPGTEGGWHFLTGDQDSITKLTQTVGFSYKYIERTGQFAHSVALMLVTPQGKLTRYYYGIEYSSRDLKLGIIEASKEKIGSPVDQLLLYCFHYDPSTGRYSAEVLAFVRIGGVITVVILAAFILVSRRRDRRRAKAGR